MSHETTQRSTTVLLTRDSRLGMPSDYFGENGCLAVSFLASDLVDLRLALHGALDGQLGGLVVVLVDLRVVLGVASG